MRIVFFGSWHLQIIQKIYQSEGWICDTPSDCPRPILRKLLHLRQILRADVIYCVDGGYLHSSYARAARFLRKKIIVHWIGTDVFEALSQPQRKIYRGDTHLACSELLQEELKSLGVDSAVLPIVPTGIEFSALPVPDRHAVLAYIPETREEFYGMPLLKKIAGQFPNTTFYIVANSGKNDKDPCLNIFYKGMLDKAEMRDMYEKCSVLFRYPKHDGLPMMMLEALGTGRTVIWKYKFPFVKTPSDDTLPSILKTLEEVLSAPPHLDQESIDYVNSVFSMREQVLRYKKAGVL